MKKVLVVLFCLLIGCTAQVGVDSTNQELTQSECSPPLIDSKTAIYVDTDNRDYTVFLDIEENTEFSDEDNIRVEDVAELAYFVTGMHAQLGLPNNSQVYDHLSTTNFLIVGEQSVYDKLSACVGDKTEVFLAQDIDSDDVSPIIRRLVHKASFATYGDRDLEYTRSELWWPLSEDSLMAKVIDLYELTYQPWNCDTGR